MKTLLLLFAATLVAANFAAAQAPSGVYASNITSTSFRANWSSVPGSISYIVHLSTSSSFSSYSTTYPSSSSTSTSFSGLTRGGTYYFRVSAVHPSSGPSGFSSSGPIHLPNPPVPPKALPATEITTESFKANWEPYSGAVEYELEYWRDYYTTIRRTTETSYTVVLGGGSSTEFQYKVRVVRSSGALTEDSNTITVVTLPKPPEALPATHLTSNSFVAHWKPSLRVSEYELDVSYDPEFSSRIAGFNGKQVNSTNAVVNGFPLQETLYYRVRAKNVTGRSENSNIIAVDLGHNYIKKSLPTVKRRTVEEMDGASKEERQITYSYFDDIGRPDQVVNMEYSPLGKDMVQPIVYDSNGRQAIQYLPFVDESNGRFKPNAFTDNLDYTRDPVEQYRSGTQFTFYQNEDVLAADAMPYSQTIFEPSLLNRTFKQGAPGAAWQPTSAINLNDKTVKFAYGTIGEHEVLLLTYNESTDEISVNPSRHYDPKALFKRTTLDEHQNEVIEYTDKDGKTVLKKVQVGEDNEAKLYASTYYVYDDYGDLIAVLPPEGIKNLLEVTSEQ